MPDDHAAHTAAGPAAESSTDHRKRPRRRGDTLNAAILDATLAELADVGYQELTMEGVAERAQASKASLYRRWPSKATLAMDAAYSALPSPEKVADTGSLRGDLLAMLRDATDQLSGPAGQAILGLMGDALASPERATEIRAHSRGSSLRSARTIVRRAAARGEVDADAITDLQLQTIQALMRHHVISVGIPVPEDAINGIVDEVLLPLFRNAHNARRQS
ncbi:AcrR family transcriptional regulator [Lipingzhangella halophila]|uniref:AcrR family transcriptional regulator n=1 Tax=Lipingzhangella halophila TaxID=1783352 RepID=A0A7W7W3E1_9ACTN|nr:TetR/AcrR family transcriptional regulator [Lipingzhangella halophila]MBB4932686.1 AcrR family transcriptional regulator [Lipingzhangella halophila]